MAGSAAEFRTVRRTAAGPRLETIAPVTRNFRVVIIGGGIAGCSALYHLTKEGWTDVALLERDELTSGTTWHSAAQVTNFGTTQTMVGLKSCSIRLYRELAADAEFPVGYHFADGGMRLAGTRDQIDGYHHFVSLAKGMGVELEVIDAAECARRHPLITTGGLAGGLWDPSDGDIDPSQLCQALARRARRAGAEVFRKTDVTGLSQRPDLSWDVGTSEGSRFHCEFIVNAGGYRANEIAGLMGASLPMVSMEHQYFVTEPVPAIAAASERMPLIRCPIADFYCRQEKQGLLVGFYERDCRVWGISGIDPAFTQALLPTDFERVMPVLEGALHRLPCLESAGIQSAVNGPITYSADGLPLVGPMPGIRNAFVITGLRAGLGEGGGHGWLLAELIVHGETSLDSWCLDPRRFGPHATIGFTAERAVDEYQNEFRFHFPGETRTAGRPARTSAVTAELNRLGADFTEINGWERAAFFNSSPGHTRRFGFRFDGLKDIVEREVMHAHQRCGIQEVCGFNRLEISGRDVGGWLDRLTCSTVPRQDGKVRLCYFLNALGNVKSEATLANLGESFWYGSAAAAELHDHDWLSAALPSDGSIRIRRLTETFQSIVIAGPKSREILQAAVQETCSSKVFPWLNVRQMRIGSSPALIYALSFSGERAYEIHVPSEQLLGVWNALWECGGGHGMAPFGLLATESMRIEKGYRHWKADLITEFDPFESALERFVNFKKPFVGKERLQARRAMGRRRAFVCLEIDCADAPAQPGACVLDRNRPAGSVTSASYGFRVRKNLAFAFVDPASSTIGKNLSVEILDRAHPAMVTELCQFDPGNQRVRS